MRARGLVVVLAVVASLAATAPPAGVATSDPCGDIVYAQGAGERVTGQPESWASFDVEHAAIEEIGEREHGTYAVRVVIDLCGPAVDPQDEQHPFQLYHVEWAADGGCTHGIQVGSEGRGIDALGDYGIGTPDQRNVFESCPELDVGGVAGTAERTLVVDIPDGALTIRDDRIEVVLRPEDLPDFAARFAPGTVWGEPRVQTRAAASTLGGSACLPSDGPTGTTCAAARDGDRVALPDLVLTDR